MPPSKYSLILLLAFLQSLLLTTARSTECLISAPDPTDATFTGVAKVITESYAEGVKVSIEIDRIIADPTKALPLSWTRQIEAYLLNPICLTSVHIGQLQTWTGNYRLEGSRLKFFVRLVQHPGSPDADPCLHKQCHPGAICETWNDAASSRVAVCTCLPLHELQTTGRCQLTTGELCASNGNIYESTCHMLRSACLQQTALTVVSWTAVNERDCQIQADQARQRSIRTQTQVVEQQTPQQPIQRPLPPSPSKYKLAMEPAKNPLMDEFNVERPQQDSVNTPVRVPSETKVEKKTECDFLCSQTEVQPVCGSDGKTYLNYCLLKLRACLSKDDPSLHIAHWGYCPAKPPDIEPIFCDHANYCKYGAFCTSHQQFHSSQSVALMTRSQQSDPERSVCTCDHYRCSKTWYKEPICGDDGVTYPGLCFLNQAACTQQSPKQVLYNGPCKIPNQDPCDTVNCPVGSICRLDDKRIPSCCCGDSECDSSENRPICASDGRTYSNICMMRHEACLGNKHLRVLFDDNCAAGVNPCLESSCPWPGEECRVDIQGRRTCVCPERCPAIVVPVCGSDGTTYDSVCHLQRTACLQKKHIWVVHAGQCSLSGNPCERRGIYCRRYEVCRQESGQGYRENSLTYVPLTPTCTCPDCPETGLGGKVCGTDGRTYRSECHLRVAACQRGLTDLEVRQRGACDACQHKECQFYSVCQTDEAGRAFCACPTNCLMVNAPVCGSDGRTYDNECLLKVHACSVQRNITVADSKPCATCSIPCPLGMRCLGGECVCRESCPKPSLAGEVCGTDGRFYPSACELRRQACINKVTVKVDGSGLACRKPTFATKIVDVQADQVVENGCGCNKIGSRDQYCDSKGRCRCHWGVEGAKCDQCAAGYWGISNGKSCVSCSCNPFGSVSVSSCDSHTGQCKCKPGIQGQQCDICSNGERLVGENCPEVKPPEPEVATMEKEISLSGLHFTPLATAVMPFTKTLRLPFVLNMNLTLAEEISEGNIALLAIPSAVKAAHFNFLRVDVVAGQPEISYVSDFSTGKVRFVTGKWKLIPGQVEITARVTVEEDLVLRVANSSTFSVVDGASSRLIQPYEYSEMMANRGIGFLMGCVSRSRARGSVCGFAGCLMDAEISSSPPNGPSQKHIFVHNGTATLVAWKHPPEDGIRVCSGKLDLGAKLKDTREAVEEPLNCGTLNPCKNDGQCIATADGTFKKCVCQPGWQGIHCQSEATIIPEFNGKAYIRLAGPTGAEALRKRKMSLEITFLRKADEGIMFAIPPSRTGAEFIVIRADTDSCLKVYLRVGRIEQFARSYLYKWLQEHFGPRQRLAIAKICSVSNDEWHKLTIEKSSLHLTVRLDDKPASAMQLLPQGLPRSSRDLRKALTTFDLSSSPVYLGGIPDVESRFIDEFVPSKQSFVGAIQKVVINGAELVLAGPEKTKKQNGVDSGRDLHMEHWESTSQWQGLPCGDDPCGRDPTSLKRICRPLGSDYECSCSTPLTHMSFVRHLALSPMLGVDLFNNVTAQQEISERAEEMACNAISTKLGLGNKDMQYDSPTRDSDNPQHGRQNELHRETSSGVFFSESTVITYDGIIPKEYSSDNIRLQLKTELADCLLLMIPERDGGISEFLAVTLNQGYPEVHLALMTAASSQKMTTLKALTYIADGNWHTIQVIRNKGHISLLVDYQMISGEVLDTDGKLNTAGTVFLGGALQRVPMLQQYSFNFTGCISALLFNEVSVNLLGDANILYGTVSTCS